jgi:hypothetical protein
MVFFCVREDGVKGGETVEERSDEKLGDEVQ